MTLQAVLLDLDGVLVDSAPVHFEAWRRLFALDGVPFPRERHDAIAVGRSREAVIELVLGPGTATPARMTTKRRLVEEILTTRGCSPIPGAPAFLREVQARAPVAIATSSRMPLAFLRAAGYASPWPEIVDRTQVSEGKPAPDVFLVAARRLGVPPAGCLVIEDAPAGVAAGRAAGCTVVALTTTTSADRLTEAHAVFDGYAALRAWPPILALLGGPPRFGEPGSA